MFYRKNLFVAALTFTVFLISIFTNAQTIIVMLKQPPPNQWHVEDMWQLTLTNTSQESYNVYLYGTVEEASVGLIFEGTSAPFELSPFFSGPVNPGDLEPVDVGYTNDDYEEIVMRTGTLPEGTYTICIYVKDYETNEELGSNCIIQPILHPSPPELIFPIDETIIENDLPVFIWLPPMPLPLGDMITYNLCIYELLDGQTAIEATEANPIWFEETGIQSTSFQFPIYAREFEQGVTYAWQVTAFDDTEDWMIGKSEVWWFKYSPEIILFKLKLLTPGLAEEIEDPYPLFSWSISDDPGNYNDINYTLKIFEVDTSSQPIDFSVEKPDVMIETQKTFYQYSGNDMAFEEGKAYVWWVEARIGIYFIVADTTHIIVCHFPYYDYGDAPDELDPPNNTHYCSHLLAGSTSVPIFPPRLSPAPWATLEAAYHENFNYEWLGNIAHRCECLGPSADAEYNGRTINLDNFDNGVDFTDINFIVCDTQTIKVLINVDRDFAIENSRYVSNSMHLHAWFDWNRDGDWDDTYTCQEEAPVPMVTVHVPADDHIYWLTAKPLCEPGGDIFNVNSYDFKIDPSRWLYELECGCQIYELTFLAGDNSFASGANVHVTGDTLWCRFRLSYDSDGGTVADNYYGGVKFGEVEDYKLIISDINQCQCTIEKVHINGTSVDEGDIIEISGSDVFLPVSRNFNVTANCGDCAIFYEWKITKPDGSVDTNPNSAFTYNFTANGVYSFEITVTCSDGTTCSQRFSVNIESSGGTVPPQPPDTLK